MPYSIDIDGDEWTVSETVYNQLDHLLMFCEDCSSEFDAEYVGHPIEGAEDEVRTWLNEKMKRCSTRRLENREITDAPS